jgi:hypothetical protein
MSAQAWRGTRLQRRRARWRRSLGREQRGRRRRPPQHAHRDRIRRRHKRRVIERMPHQRDLTGPWRAAIWRQGMARRGAARHADRRVDVERQGGQRERAVWKAAPLQQQQRRQKLGQKLPAYLAANNGMPAWRLHEIGHTTYLRPKHAETAAPRKRAETRRIRRRGVAALWALGRSALNGAVRLPAATRLPVPEMRRMARAARRWRARSAPRPPRFGRPGTRRSHDRDPGRAGALASGRYPMRRRRDRWADQPARPRDRRAPPPYRSAGRRPPPSSARKTPRRRQAAGAYGLRRQCCEPRISSGTRQAPRLRPSPSQMGGKQDQ